MPAKVKVPTYEVDVNQSVGQVVDGVNRDIFRIKKNIERDLLKLNRNFYTILSRKIVGTISAPDLGSYSPPKWKPLSPKTIKAKGHSEFYRKTGALQRWLFGADAEEILGIPEVRIKVGGANGKVRGTLRTILRTSKTGKKWVQKIGVGVGGRFVSTKALQDELNQRLIVYPFGVKSAQGSQSIPDLISGGNNSVYHKLTNYKGKQERPIASHYLDWWVNVRVKQIVDRYA